MRILFLTHYFPPEVNAPAVRTFDHCCEWVRAGHEVHVVTCVPSHPHGLPFPNYRSRWYQRELVEGIHVHRVWTYLAPNQGVIRRVANFVSFVPTAVLCALSLGRFDVAIGTSPQFFCAVAAWIYALVSRTAWIFELRDLWPESIPAVGALKPSLALSILARLEMRMYRHATAIVCLTNAFIANLERRGIPKSKTHYIPNGVVVDLWRNADRNGGRELLKASREDVIISYVGTVGMAHGLDRTLEAAKALEGIAPQATIVIVGDGAELERLKQTAASSGISNVRFLGQLPRRQIPSLLAATDIALVTLKPSEVFKTVLPSKMFEAMAAARPIVLAVEGEAEAMLERAGAGIAVRPGDAGALASALASLASDSAIRATLGLSGQAFVEKEFSRTTWAHRYLNVIEATAQDPTALS